MNPSLGPPRLFCVFNMIKSSMVFPDFSEDIRLIVSDMDGTLLGPDGTLSADFFPILDQLLARGCTFVVASGRQYFNLREIFHDYLDKIYFIAENGSYVAYKDQPIAILEMDKSFVNPIVQAVRALKDCHAVYCGASRAYIEDEDPEFVQEVSKYYHQLEVVPDLTLLEGELCLKIAVCNLGEAPEYGYPHLCHFEKQGLKVVLSGKNWVDLSEPTANKGVPLSQLQQRLGIPKEQTLAFGDQMNDLEMLACAHYSFAVENAYPALKPYARYQAPANAEQGVLQVLRHLCKIYEEKMVNLEPLAHKLEY